MARAAPTDVFAYGEYVFGYEPQPHHRAMIEFIHECISDREDGAVLMPRGSAKTTWGNTINNSWLVSCFSDLRIGLVSNTATQALDFSEAIRLNLESNGKQRDLFGDLRGARWTNAEWRRKGSRWENSPWPTVYAVGVGGAIISKRFDLIICDDILDKDNTATPEQREAVENWFWMTLRPCLAPGGVMIVMGTRWAQDDLYQKLIDDPEKGGKGWRNLIVQAVTKDDKGNEASYWPTYWPLARLAKEREQMGSAMFFCSYQNDISGLMTGTVFRRQDFQYYDQLDPTKHYTIRMGLDLAFSEKERADFTARVTTAEDNEGNFYVMSAVRDKRETHHAEFILDGWQAHPTMSLVPCENNQAQSMLVQEVLRRYPQIPIVGRKTDTDKTERARSVSTKYEGHKVYHHISLKGGEFEQELVNFSKGHDDQVDALGFSMDLGGTSFIFGSLRRP